MDWSKIPIAIVYDRVNKFGGAERVLLALHDAFPNSTLFTSVYDQQGAPWVGDWKIVTSFLQRIPFFRTRHEKAAVLMPLAFETLQLGDYPIIISVTSEYAKAVMTKPSQLHVCYCLTPTRYLWSHTFEYEGGRFAWLRRLIFNKLRLYDYIAASRPDLYIAISKRIQSRIEKYYRKSVHAVIYPPLTIPAVVAVYPKEDFFLIVSRLVEYKRIDLAILTCISLREHLVIVGSGSDKRRLKKIAAESPFITFVDFVSESKLEQYYIKAKALLCPQEEDFGIVSLEAQLRGTPVITYAQSGVAETIEPGVTGILVHAQTVSALACAIEEFKTIQWDKKKLFAHAVGFSKERFIQQMQETISKQYSKCLNNSGVE